MSIVRLQGNWQAYLKCYSKHEHTWGVELNSGWGMPCHNSDRPRVRMHHGIMEWLPEVQKKRSSSKSTITKEGRTLVRVWGTLFQTYMYKHHKFPHYSDEITLGTHIFPLAWFNASILKDPPFLGINTTWLFLHYLYLLKSQFLFF